MKNECILVLAFLFFASSCKEQGINADGLANEYCECLEQNNVNVDYYNARTLCDSKFIVENRFFRIQYIEALYGRYMGTLSEQTKDSVNKFSHEFFVGVSARCPYVYKSDSIAADYLRKHK
jgi:hypothetical protein